jgi:hypothetical protein
MFKKSIVLPSLPAKYTARSVLPLPRSLSAFPVGNLKENLMAADLGAMELSLNN